MLVLFDVDATLITTSRAGILAMGDAGRDLFGSGFTVDKTEFAGRLDPLIIHDLLVDNTIDPITTFTEKMREGYRDHLERRLSVPGVAKALDGAAELVAALAEIPGVTVGLLTGNFPETGRIKLSAAGIEPDAFDVHVWGEDSPSDPPTRDDLPGVAMRRYADLGLGAIEPSSVLIIGDTVHDIACARAHGCRALGVATGSYPREALAHADHAVDSLGDVRSVLAWALEGFSPRAQPG